MIHILFCVVYLKSGGMVCLSAKHKISLIISITMLVLQDIRAILGRYNPISEGDLPDIGKREMTANLKDVGVILSYSI